MIVFEEVVKRYGDRSAVDGLTLTIDAGEFFVLLGPSGCGKSTTLRLVNALIAPDSGRVLVNGADNSRADAERLRRGIGYVIQSVGLFPHWNVADNVATVPRLLRWPEARVAARVAALLDLLGLDPALTGKMFPHQLSGGQQQRVGVARALAADPPILLMDEPFGALDPLTRAGLQKELKAIHAATGKTIVFVTHDVDEALGLASRIGLMDAGKLVADGTPAEVLAGPAGSFAGDFLGGPELGLRRLSVETAGVRMRPGEAAPGAPVEANLSLREALSLMVARGADRLPVADGAAGGTLHLADLVRR